MNSTPHDAPLRNISRFSLRSLLLLTAAIALCLFTGMRSDWVAGVGLLLALTLAVVARLLPASVVKWWVRYGLLMVAVGIGWFASVDRLFSMHHCERCESHYFAGQYRLLGVTLYEVKYLEHTSLLGLVATDLGRPCEHRLTQLPMVRRWGLLYPARPSMGLTCCLGRDRQHYVENHRARVIKLGEEQPQVADEFYAWLLQGDEKDYTFHKKFFERLSEID